MKKLLIMLAVCIILCAMPFTVSAERLPDVPYGLPEGQQSSDIAHLLPDVDYAKDELIVYIDYRFDFSEICDEEFKNSLHTYTKGGETFDFFGLKVTEVRLFDSTILPADEWYKDYGYYFYWVTLDSSVSVPEALDIIYPQEHVTATVMGLEHIPEDVPRDVNGDFKVNMFDYMLAKSLYFNSESGTADQLSRADVNKDGKVDVLDMMAIKTYIFNA